jgi:predicted nucleic acid-binding protein
MILDTNAISALAAKDPALNAKLANASCAAVTLISLGEYKFGLVGSSFREDLENWLNAFLQKAELLLPNSRTLDHYARIRNELKTAGTPIPANDVWIASIVEQHKMPLLSRDRHFDRVRGIERIEW